MGQQIWPAGSLFVTGFSQGIVDRLSKGQTAIVGTGLFAVIAGVIGVTAWMLADARQTSLEPAYQSSENLASTIELDARRTIETYDLSLKAVIAGLDMPEIATLTPQIRDAILFDQSARAPQFGGIVVIDEAGKVTLSSSTQIKLGTDYKDRDFFSAQRDQSNLGLFFSAPLKGNFTGQWVMFLSRRLTHPDGRFAGVVVGTLRLTNFNQALANIDLGAGGAITMFRTDGTVLARTPYDDASIGRLIDNEPALDHFRNFPRDHFEANGRLSDIPLLFVYRQVGNLPLLINVTVAKTTVLADWYRKAVITSGIVSAMIVALITLTWVLIGELKRRGDAERRYRLLADHSSDLIVLSSIDDDTRLYVSPGSRHLYGYEPEELLGGKVESIVHSDDIELVRTAQRRLRTTDHALVTYRARRKDGQYIWVEASWTKVLNEKTGAPEAVVNARDVTARIRSEEALRAAKAQADTANQMKTEFLANVSHEIRTPMNGIIGMSQLLLGTKLNPEQNYFTQTIHECGETLLHLINDLLDVSKLESGKVQVEDIPFDVPAVVDKVISLLTPRTQEKGIALTATIHPEARGCFIGDPTRLRQVLTNLVGNATKFTTVGSVHVDVSASGQNDATPVLRFEVSDTGVGISEQALPRLFQKFSQADGSITRRFGGTGLGLAISKQFVELMGGTIQVASKLGVGSRFWFELRLARAASMIDFLPPQVVLEPITARRRLRVLLVEDNAVNQQVARLHLEKAGHAVDVVDSGRKAVAAVEGENYDVVLMDIQMADMDGIEATALIRALPEPRGGIPIIAMTANADVGKRDEYLAAGMNDYVSKPFKTSELIAALDRATNATPVLDIDTPANSNSSATEFDPAPLDELKEQMDRAKFSHTVGIFAESLDALLQRLEISLAQNRWTDAAKEAHDVVSIAGHVGANRLCALAQEIERRCKTKDEAGCRSLSAAFPDVAATALRALKRYQSAA